MIPNGDTSIPQSYRLMQTTKQPELQYWEKKLSLQVKSYLTVTACFINNDRGLQWLIADKGKLMELLVFHYNNIFNVYFHVGTVALVTRLPCLSLAYICLY